MNINIREYMTADAAAASEIWNQVVDDGVAFPQEECLDEKTGAEFFAAQTYTAVAENMGVSHIQALRMMKKRMILSDSTYFIRTTWEDADIYVTPAMP